MSGGFDERSLDDYVDVAERIAQFREKYPEGSLQPADPYHPFQIVTAPGLVKNGSEWQRVEATFIAYTAAAYRHPDDPRPGIACAWEPLPGRTPYTRNSELQNAETSAWGRAIQAVLAADARRSIASYEEVRNRRAERESADQAAPPPSQGQAQPQRSSGPPAEEQEQAQLLANTAAGVKAFDDLRGIHDEAHRRNLLSVEIARPGDGDFLSLGAYLVQRRREITQPNPQSEAS